MPVGDVPTSASLNGELGGLIVRLRDVCHDISELQMQVTGIGQGGLVAAGFSAGDATTFMNAVSYLNTVAGVYQGTATQGSTFNFDNALSAYVVGQ
jgi:hypothetical protein